MNDEQGIEQVADDLDSRGASPALEPGRRALYWVGVVGLVLVLLYGLIIVLASLAYADTFASRAFGALGAASVIASPAWMWVLGGCARRGVRVSDRSEASRRRMRAVGIAAIAVGIAFFVLLTAINAGEWSLAPVG
jgi:hypothetical protein